VVRDVHTARAKKDATAPIIEAFRLARALVSGARADGDFDAGAMNASDLDRGINAARLLVMMCVFYFVIFYRSRPRPIYLRGERSGAGPLKGLKLSEAEVVVVAVDLIDSDGSREV